MLGRERLDSTSKQYGGELEKVGHWRGLLDSEKPSIEERVGRALSRGNMRQREGACDLDVVTALGLVGIREKLADACFRLKYSNDPKSYNEALEGVYGLARALDARNRWRLNRRRLRWMSKIVLDYWLADGCRLCTGLRYLTIHGTPHLSDRQCPACHGSGKREMPWVFKLPRIPEGRGVNRTIKQVWREKCQRMQDSQYRCRQLLVELEISERQIAEKMRARLARAA